MKEGVSKEISFRLPDTSANAVDSLTALKAMRLASHTTVRTVLVYSGSFNREDTSDSDRGWLNSLAEMLIAMP